MQFNDKICKIIETVRVHTNFIHNLLVYYFIFGQACCVNQYHYATSSDTVSPWYRRDMVKVLY
jgi:hypothetical protein